ncbi:hypothetical protein GGH13_001886 [Coemansia sp. S155-1]|nr:hypothetical protein GGH13_001886 [Coemansia sp. S155-1]
MPRTPTPRAQGQPQGLGTPDSSLANYTITDPQHKSTPVCNLRAYEFHERQLPLDDRRELLASTLGGLETSVKFPELLCRLGLENAYKEYEVMAGKMFDNVAGKLLSSILKNAYVEREDPDEKLAEKTYVKKLMEVVRFMLNWSLKGKRLPKMSYEILDGQHTSIDKSSSTSTPTPNSKLRPDVVFLFSVQGETTFRDVFMFLEAKGQKAGPKAQREHLSQVADYALALWECQPTRTFVPVLFLDRCKLYLYVFTRAGYFKTYIGPVLYTDRCDIKITSTKIGLSLRCLWFLLTLPAGMFGFFNTPWSVPCRLQTDASTFPATVEETRDSDDTVVFVKELIKRPVQITGRCSYLFNAKYGDEEVVLKLAWTCTNQLPEGAIYRVLEARGVPNIPKIYKSGVIIKDFDGYRLEVLVMEHCGTPIVEHILRMPKGPLSISCVDRLVKDSIRGVLETLTEALAADILHRDISPGNIAIKDGAAYVIDWGCAKFLLPPADLDLRAEIAKHWSFNWDKVLKTKSDKNAFNAAPLCTSTRLLLGADTRGIYDDLESLLYVILDALSNRPRTGKPDEQPLGFRFYDSSSMAMTRLTCTHSSLLFRNYFGVSLPVESTLGGVLDAMRRFLFFDNGTHLVGRILEMKDFPRSFNNKAAKTFMSDKTVRGLLRLVGEKNEQQSPLAVETTTTTTSLQVLVHDPKPASLPPHSFSIRSAKQATLGDDDHISMDNIEAYFPNIDSPPVSPCTRSSGTSSRRNPSPSITLSPAKNRSRFSTPSQSVMKIIKKGASQAGPSRIPTCHTSHRNGAKPTDDSKRVSTPVGPSRIPAPFTTSDAGAISRNNSSVKVSNATKPPGPSPRQTRSRANALASLRRSPTKVNSGPVEKTNANCSSSSTGDTKRAANTPPGGAPAKRQKH